MATGASASDARVVAAIATATAARACPASTTRAATSSWAGPQLGADFQRQCQVTDEFAKEAGFRVKVNIIDYTSDYLTKYRDANGKYDGYLYRAGGSSATDATAFRS